MMMMKAASTLAFLLLAQTTNGRSLSQEGALDLDMEGNLIDATPSMNRATQESLIGMQFSNDPYSGRDHYSMIVNGELNLSGLRYSPHSFKSIHNGDYYDVHGEFCVYDPTLNRSDPAGYATSSAIMNESEHCAEHRYTLPLHEVMNAIKQAEGTNKNMKTLPVSGLIFHEGYSGAGLISNALAIFESNLVVAEHTALRDALDACDVERNRYLVDDCSSTAQRRLIEDVVMLLSRTTDASSKHLYLKLSSGSSAYIPMMLDIYPDAAWSFVYRNAEDALAKTTERTRSSACIKSRRNPSMALSTKSSEHHVDLEGLTNTEVCSLYLSSLIDMATRVNEESGTGLLVSYDHELLPTIITDSVLEVILPYFGLKQEIDADPMLVREKVSKVLVQKSNNLARGGEGAPIWTKEEIHVSDEVKAASTLFLKDSTDVLEVVARRKRA